MGGWVGGWMDGWVDGWVGMDGWVGGWVGWVGDWVGGWMDGWMDGCVSVTFFGGEGGDAVLVMLIHAFIEDTLYKNIGCDKIDKAPKMLYIIDSLPFSLSPKFPLTLVCMHVMQSPLVSGTRISPVLVF